MDTKPKDAWDKTVAAADVISKVVIAAASVAITWYVQTGAQALERQRRDAETDLRNREVLFKKVETLRTLLPGLADGQSPVQQRLAMIAIGEMAESRELVFKLLKAIPDPPRGELAAVYGDEVVRKMLSSAAGADPLVAATVTAAYGVLAATPAASAGEPPRRPREKEGGAVARESGPGMPAASALNGWSYLGYWDAASESWTTRYFDFDPRARPESLTGKTIRVRERTGAINVRSDIPDQEGRNRPVRAVLQAGTGISAKEVVSWKDGAVETGFKWVQIGGLSGASAERVDR